MRLQYKQKRFYLSRKINCIEIRKKNYDRSVRTICKGIVVGIGL